MRDEKLVAKHRQDHFVAQYYRKDTLEDALRTAGFGEIEIRPIFCSRFARQRFEAGIRSGFTYGYFGALLTHARLRLHEALTPNREKGIFLIARARKV